MKLETKSISFRLGIIMFIIYVVLKTIDSLTFSDNSLINLAAELALYIFILFFGFYIRNYNNKLIGNLFICLSIFLTIVLLIGYYQ